MRVFLVFHSSPSNITKSARLRELRHCINLSMSHLKKSFEIRKTEMENSPSQFDAQIVNHSSSEAESQLSSLVYDMSQQVQTVMTNMLKMMSEIDQNSAGIMEEIEKSKNLALEKKKDLEQEKEHFQKAAYTVLEMLTNRD